MRIALAAALLALTAVPGRAAVDERTHKEAVKHYRAGQAALQTERYAEAEQAFRQSIGLDPLLVAAHYGLGQTMMATKRYPDAVTAFIAAAEAFKEAQIDAASNEMETQRRLNDQIKALQEDNRNAQRQAGGQYASAINAAVTRNEEQIRTLESLRKRGSEGPLPTPHWLSFALGSAYFRAGDLAKAEVEYRAALEQKPDLGEGHLNLGVVCMLTGRLDEAESEVVLAEKAGIRIPPALKEDIQKRRGAQP
jgi:protein O-GlcNAc transferase